MIDFNTVLNTLFQAALEQHTAALTEKIEAQEKRIADMEEFFNKWNFGNNEKFADAVVEVVKDKLDGWVVQQAQDAVEESVDTAIRDMDLTNDIEKALDNIDLDDRIRTFIKDNVTISAEIEV